MVRSSFLPSVIFAMGIIPAACKVTRSGSDVQDTVSYEQEEIVPVIGEGYDSYSQVLKPGISCVTGKIDAIQVNTSEVQLTQSNNVGKVASEFTGEVKGTPRMPFFIANAAAGFYKSLGTTNSSVNVIYTAKVIVQAEKLSSPVLPPEHKALKNVDLLRQCGDQYVVQVNKGGALTVGITFNFGSEQKRKKWQGLVNFSLPWADLGKDLKDKIESNNLDGTMTIRVRQKGGNAEQALSGVKTCSLNSAEDFAACQARMDEVLSYAADQFPAQVRSQPTPISYQTASLTQAGASNFPALTDDVLKARSDLAARAEEYEGLVAEITKTEDRKLPVDAAAKNAVLDNLKLVKDIGKSCFEYEIDGANLSFKRCLSEVRRLTTSMKQFNKDALKFEKLAVAANKQNGDMIVNSTAQKMTITYVVDDKDTWNFGTSYNPSFDGYDHEKGNRSSTDGLGMVRNLRDGTLLVRKGQNLEAADVKGQATIYPGEALNFLMNDVPMEYDNNKGTIGVYWRCLDCSSAAKERTTERITVHAKQYNGTDFVNHADRTCSYNVVSYGLWRGSASWAWSDSRGINQVCGSSCPMPKANDQTLVYTVDGKNYDLVGAQKRIQVEAGGTIKFVFNDDNGGYNDNSGSMDLIIQGVDCG